MSAFLTSFDIAEKLVRSKQNRENAIALIGSDKFGDESFIQWVQPTDRIAELVIPKHIKSVRAKAGTLS